VTGTGVQTLEVPAEAKSINNSISTRPALICFSHLRWDFVWQRPHHLLSRAARSYDVTYVEEPVFCEGPVGMVVRDTLSGVRVARLKVPPGTAPTVIATT
jgi:ribonuclease BN (tRNA processing enzyme)